MSTATTKKIALGDPVPWFRAKDMLGQTVDLHVAAGRWVILAFLGTLADPEAQKKLAALAARAASFSNDHLIIYAMLSVPPEDIDQILAMSSPVLKFIADYDGALGCYYGANGKPRTIALDPML